MQNEDLNHEAKASQRSGSDIVISVIITPI